MAVLRYDEGWRFDSGLTWDGAAPADTGAGVRLLCDFDRDGYWCAGALPGDALNGVPTPVWWAFGIAGYDGYGGVTLVDEATAYGVRVARLAGVSYGVWIGIAGSGSSPVIDQWPVSANTTYTATVWARGVTGHTAALYDLAVWDDSETLLGLTAGVALTGDWTRIQRTFTTGPAATHVALTLLRQGAAAAQTVDVTGFMLVQGSVAPAAFNAGDPTNMLDDLTARVIGLNAHYGFAEQPDLNVAALAEGVAEPAELTATLDNADGALLPEAGGTFAGLLAPGLLVKALARAGGQDYPLFVGRLKRLLVAPGLNDSRRATLVVRDLSDELLDAEYKPDLQENVTVDAALAPIFERGLVPWPYARNYWLLGIAGASELGVTTRLFTNTLTDFETARTTLGYAGDALDNGAGVSAQGAIRDLVAAEAGGRFFYDARRGVYVFQHRAHDTLNRGVAATFSEADLLPEPESFYTYGDGVVNAATVHFEQRVADTTESVVWQAESPTRLRAGETRALTVRYADPDAPATRLAAFDVALPVPGLDYTVVNDDGQPAGAQWIAVSAQPYADKADLTLANTSPNGDETLTITGLRLRGRAVRSFPPAQASALNAQSIADYERRDSPPLYLRAVADPEFARQVAEWYANRFAAPIARYAYVSFEAAESETLLGHALRLNVGDRITITHARIGHDRDYIIAGMTQTITLGSHRVRLALTPAERTHYWLLGVAGFSELGVSTRLFL